jgi:hypothetical protein
VSPRARELDPRRHKITGLHCETIHVAVTKETANLIADMAVVVTTQARKPRTRMKENTRRNERTKLVVIKQIGIRPKKALIAIILPAAVGMSNLVIRKLVVQIQESTIPIQFLLTLILKRYPSTPRSILTIVLLSKQPKKKLNLLGSTPRM